MLKVTQDRHHAHISENLSSKSNLSWHWNLVYSIMYSITTKIIQMITPGWP